MRKHIVFLARWYPHRYDPMFGLFVQRHAEAAALYNDVSVIYVHADENVKEKYEIERSTANNVSTIKVYYRKPRLKTFSLIRFFNANKLALKQLKKPDLIHVHVLTRCGVVALWQKIINGTPYIITEHWSRYLPGNDFGGFLRKMMTKFVVKNASTVTTVTGNLAKAMQNHGLKNNNYVVLPNVVDVNLFKPIEKRNSKVKIIHVSCFEDKSKNISGLIDALALLESRNVEYQCVFIGEGIDFEAMKGYAATKLNPLNIKFTGLLQGQALANEMASGDFLVLSSNYENMPVVILEALACGLPVVSTNVGGISEMIDENCGILVPAKDTEKLADAMQTMISNLNYDINSLRNKILDKYSYEAVGKFLNEIY
ncbi:MAG: glycosyltransferase [Bacteroidales bacterium]|nr:glycosyltransferase [Bacteroidales bacterium]